MIPASEALGRLQDGNRRFVDQVPDRRILKSQSRLTELTKGQEPFAVILGCSDSRVPAEFIFDQGLGDLFVIRVAGNIVAPSQVGSVEFAAAELGTRLVAVLGHTQCGAVTATLRALEDPSAAASQNIRSIVDRITPSVAPLWETELRSERDALIQRSVRANVRAAANQLRHGSQVLEDLADHDGLAVVGAEYSLETGLVDFFDGVPLTG